MVEGLKVVLTGGAGFIGSHLVHALANNQARVTVIDNLSAGDPSSIQDLIESGKITFHKEDLRGLEKIQPSLQARRHSLPLRGKPRSKTLHKGPPRPLPPERDHNPTRTRSGEATRCTTYSIRLKQHSLRRRQGDTNTRNTHPTTHKRLRRHQGGGRNTLPDIRTPLRPQMPNTTLRQHNRPKATPRSNLRLHKETPSKPRHTRNPRRRHPKEKLPIHNRHNPSHARSGKTPPINKRQDKNIQYRKPRLDNSQRDRRHNNTRNEPKTHQIRIQEDNTRRPRMARRRKTNAPRHHPDTNRDRLETTLYKPTSSRKTTRNLLQELGLKQ